jgi:hypothetical protein
MRYGSNEVAHTWELSDRWGDDHPAVLSCGHRDLDAGERIKIVQGQGDS